ncbi:GNAT family N-acetyltransferase [Maritimibacter dapengensis]|uniref:GNAT family N-acetyltransferase n=1 Tax=Maritimibacter dapengensis TaxID=2836868 RepID=A0ABS6T5E7_9RHOB|nr:GNAT family N-acetyltransferase [Maritimibacter dapengensis]MBV7380488.1 GNAT family N-acetyltransferase [Maritimibacter dapengensis]
MEKFDPATAIRQFSTDRLDVAHWDTALDHPETRANLMDQIEALLTPPVLAPLPPHFAFDRNNADDWIAARRETSEVYLVERRDRPGLAGLLILAEIAPRELYLGYLLAEAQWGQGVGGELVRGLVSVLTRHPPLEVSAQVVTENIASARLLLGAGFRETGSDDEIRRFLLTLSDSTPTL